MTDQVISANRLRDGLVVYLAADDSWSEDIAAGEIVRDDDGAAALLARAEHAVSRQVVVDPYLIAVGESDGVLRPTKYREFIRATGPSVRTDLSKQNYVPGGDA